MSEEPNKAKIASSGEVKQCPYCGVPFETPIPGGQKGECADVEDGGCGRRFVVVFS